MKIQQISDATLPKSLKHGDTIGITCPSGQVTMQRVAYCKTVLEKWGFRVVLGKTVGSEHFYFSGTDAERLADLQHMLDSPEIDCILMGRGGYGMSKIVDSLDFSGFKYNPKWICGFSDITVIHNHIHANYGIPTLHSPMCGHYKPETEQEAFLISFLQAITTIEQLRYTAPPDPFNRIGNANGILTGGNLALIAHLTGSPSEVDTTGKILFLEDLSEYLYNIDRMMVQLKRAGKLKNLAGIIFGGFTDLKDTEIPFGKTIKELLSDIVKEYNYPVCFDFPVGHQDINFTLKLGLMHRLEVFENGTRLVSN
jgi:muramoyltetrapeptide carboxypeptidase